MTAHSCNFSDTNLWHVRLGHVPLFILKQLPLNLHCKHTTHHCDICYLAKQTRLPFHLSEPHTTAEFELIHCDIWGPYKHCTHGKCNQFLTIVDDFSRCTLVFLFHDKSQVHVLLEKKISMVQTQFQCQIKFVRSDNGTEFVNKDLTPFLELYIKLAMLKLHNKMVLWRKSGNTDICLTLQELLGSILISQFLFGETAYSQQHIL